LRYLALGVRLAMAALRYLAARVAYPWRFPGALASPMLPTDGRVSTSAANAANQVPWKCRRC
jgi:hypothetical protein